MQNELNDDREQLQSNRGLEKGILSSTFAFCQAQSDPYYKTTCHHVASSLNGIISQTLVRTSKEFDGAENEDASTLLMRSKPVGLRHMLDKLMSPDGHFTFIGGGDGEL